MSDEKDERRVIAERLFEAMRIPHRSGYHLRRRVRGWLEGDEFETLCGRKATEATRPHPTDKICNPCLEAAQAIVDEEINQRFHDAIALVPEGHRAPHARPAEVEKRRGWMRGGLTRHRDRA